MYKSIARWRDLEDNHIYSVGEVYPHNGREVSAERIAQLSSKQNKAGFALIKAVEVPVEQKPVQSGETPKKAPRGRKKAV